MGSKNKNKKNKDKDGAVASGDGGQGSGSKQGDGRNRGNIITDARFASLHSDPRFMEAPKNKAKVTIDSRFNSMFTDKNFASSQARIDKRGKPKKDSGDEFLKHYYRLEDEEEEERARKIERIEQLFKDEETGGGEESEELMSEDDESESSGSEESEEDKRKKKNLKVKNESEESESEVRSGDDSSTSTSDEDEEEEDAELYDEEEEGALAQEENIPEIDKETHRLAVVNMDWSQVKAVDLFVLLNSFLPKNGHIKSVSVYPSEFGLKRMEEEALHGPVGLFDEDQHKNVEDEEDDDDDDDDDEIDNEKLRAYEISRLRYYYAVVECDSVTTADYLYNNCDGVEFERSSTKLDLRFIPDSMEFKHQPRDVATEAPADFEGADFHTRALQHSKIQLTWDEDEPQRAKTLKRKLNTDQLAELELKEFLASDESESNDSSDEDVPQDMPSKKQKKQESYRALLQSGDGSEENDQDEEEKKDMEVTFSTGLEDLSKRILEKKDRKSESVWDAYLRKRREKKRDRKNRSKNSSEDESSDTDNEPVDEPDDFFIEESHNTKGSKKNKNSKKEKQDDEMAQEAEASRAELELLLADDKGTDANLKGYNLKRKKLKGKRGKEAPDEGKLPTVDYEDPRFSALFNSPLFALDPTDPQFKRSAAYARQMAQKQQKGERENGGTIEKTNDESKIVKDGNELPSKKEKHELSSLVKSIKMKSKQVVSNNGKSSKESKQKHAKAS